MRTSNFRRRLIALEKRGLGSRGFVLVRITRWGADGLKVAEEAQRLITGAPGQVWVREPAETEDEFIARARREMPAPAAGIARVLVVSNPV